MPHAYILEHADGNVQICGEGVDAEAMINLLAKGIKVVQDQMAQAAAQANGGAMRRPSGLVVPPTVMPRNIRNGDPQQP